MADPLDKHPENVSGPFYIDTACIICDMCLETAPSMFKATDDQDHAYVHRQPSNEEEMELAREALANCPVEAIGESSGSESAEGAG